MLQLHHRRSRAPLFAALALGAATFGCGGGEEPAETAKAAPEPPSPPPKVATPKPPQPPPEPVRRQETAEASYMADTRWASGAEGKLIQGLNGGQYPPYKPSFIEEVQRFLFERELYDGPVTGVLDEATMEAVAAFQRAQGVEASGVPSPQTRAAMPDAGGES